MAGDGSNNANTGVWNPLEVVEKTEVPQLAQTGNMVTWTADEYAICYVVSVNGSVSAFTTATEYAAQPGDEVRVQSVNSHGALSAPSLPLKVSTGIEAVTAGDRKTQMHHIYNTLGQKVTTARQGVYIVDGQTVILK